MRPGNPTDPSFAALLRGRTAVGAPLILGCIATKFVVAQALLAGGVQGLTWLPLLTTAAAVSGCGALLACFTGRRLFWLAWTLNICCSLLLVGDLWFHRFYGDLPSLDDLPQWGNLQFVGASLQAQTRWTDAWFIVDLPLLAFFRRTTNEDAGLTRTVAGLILLAVTAACPALVTLLRDPDDVFMYRFERSDLVAALGVPGYHAFDAVEVTARALETRLREVNVDQLAAERAILARRRSELPSPLAGIARGRNVIVLSAESLQAFVLHKSVNGHPLTPHLNAFAAESLFFTDFYDQTHMGTTAEAEFIAMASRLPLERGVAATRFASNSFHALPHALAAAGYQTFSAAAEPPSFWNMRRMHRALGFTRSLFLPDFAPGEWLGVGLNDVSFFDQATTALPDRAPFLAYLLSSSSHHPFDLPRHHRVAHLTTAAGTMAGDYLQSIRYFDQAFGRFIGRLRERNLLESSVIVVYGDHQSWLEDEDLQSLHQALEGHAPSGLELWRYRRQTPLMIRLPKGEGAGPRPVPGGLVDVAPTVLSLLGMDLRTGPWLGHDLTGPAGRLVAFRDGSFTDGEIFGIHDADDRFACFSRRGTALNCNVFDHYRREGQALLELSDDITRRNLARPLKSRLEHLASSAPRARVERVAVIAHRGASLKYPENTIEAVEGALRAGADAVEIDIRLSRDGVPMVFHDDTLERTSNGLGLVRSKTMAELKRLDAGRWMGVEHAGARIPTLLEMVTAAAGRVPLLLDLKDDGMADAVAAVFAAAGVDRRRAWIGGWSRTQRDDFALRMPGALVLQTEPAPLIWGPAYYDALKRQGVGGFEIGDEWPAAFVADARLNGWPVIAYTVNDEPTMQRLIELGVTGIETDDPELLSTVARRMGAR